MAKSGAERMQELRERQKAEDKKVLSAVIPRDYKDRFDRLRRQLNATVAETVCYLIDLDTEDDEDEASRP